MKSNYAIVKQDETRILIEDLGPWDLHKTVTNDVESVVESMLEILRIDSPKSGEPTWRRLFYIDSDGREDEIVIDKFGRFVTFA